MVRSTKHVSLALFALLLLCAAGCGNDDATLVADPPSPQPQPGGSSGETPGQPPPCVQDPVTHLDIINACTNAVGVRKTPQLTLLNPDGSLPAP
jgi:hypothetical protein